MDTHKRKIIDGWRVKAQNQLVIADDCLKKHDYSESIQASQEAIELNVKSILSLLTIEYPLTHEWKPENKPFEKIAHQIKEKKTMEKIEKAGFFSVRLPRLLLIFNFWGQFNTIAKYGFESGDLASARDLFIFDDEAKLAYIHAKECERAFNQLFYLTEDQLDAIIRA